MEGNVRMIRRAVSILAVAACAVLSARAQGGSYPDFEIVESIPVETVLDNPDVRNTGEVWLEMINRATRSLDIEQFYISNQAGEPLDEVLRAIIRAAERGVTVRVLVDSRMYKTYPESADLFGKQKNIEMRVIDYGQIAGGVQHAKYFIVDNTEVFFGSQNFDWRALKHIHELGVRMRHPQAVRVYEDIFNLDWDLSKLSRGAQTAAERQVIIDARVMIPGHYSTPFQLVEPGNDTIVFSPTCSPRGLIPDTALWDETQIVRLIDGATSGVMCQFLTYSPVGRDKSYYPVLENALRRAAARGVKVKMIVSDWSKEHPVEDYLKSLAQIPNIQVKYSVIPDWSKGYVSFARVEHLKYLVVDSASCWIGTANWEKSYFYSTRNVGVSVQNGRISKLLRRIFLKGWDGPYTEAVRAEVDYRSRRHGE
ncbi:MAG TPA: phospholipase D-like domain-containing protein [Bacteroidota bacterium]|jgi:phosphatidylserine/phosphatidylglycerophosphate/cardiolipin synthase-like enzyme